jgi:prepilin-type N-terminal cleavage/methylation domain-containing protein
VVDERGPVSSPWPGPGYSLIEVVFVLGLVAVLSSAALPRMLVGLDDLRASGAARYVASRLQQTRLEAVTRNANTALRFTPVGDGMIFTAYIDGNRNGVRTLDIERGLDRPIRAGEQLRNQFSGVDFGTQPDLPAVDSSGPPPGADPIRLGVSNMVSFTPDGSATPGSLYVRGQRNTQLVVRILGETGRTRILRFDPRARIWKPL